MGRRDRAPRQATADGPRRAGGAALWLGRGAVALTAATLVAGLLIAPPDAVQGQSQRLMYVHVPSAWTAFAAFGVVAVASAAVLLCPGSRWDDVAQAAAEVGVATTALTIAEGSIWGHLAWGAWWAWDPRLVTTAFLLLLYTAYLALRALPGDQDRVRRRAAVAGLVFVVWVPVVHFSVLWWRTLHQPPTLLQPSLSAPIDPLMLMALLLGVAASTCAAAWYVVRRVEALAAAGRPSPTVEAVVGARGVRVR
jgi:heme exporter protein C